MEWCVERARDFDFVFAAQRDGADHLRRTSNDRTTWLPLACDPEIHGKQDTGKRYDVCFVGHIFPGARAELLERIHKRFPNNFLAGSFGFGEREYFEAEEGAAATPEVKF